MTTTPTTPTTPPPPTPRAPDTRPALPVRQSWSGWRTLLAVLGTLLLLSGVSLLAVGGVGLWADQQRDATGFFTAGPERLTTDTSALSTPKLDINGYGPDAFYTDDFLGEVRIELQSRKAETPLFVGIGPADQVARYLDGVAHDELDDIDVDPFGVTYNSRPGGQPTDAPDTQSFWVASDTGTGARSLNWDASSGDWALVIMNADGSPGIDLDISAGARLPAVLGISIASFIAAAMLLICGIAIIVATVATRPTGRGMAGTPPTAPGWPTAP